MTAATSLPSRDPNLSADEWLTREQAAHYLSQHGFEVKPRTLEKWASNSNEGKGPPYTRFGWKKVKYLKTDLATWLESRKTKVT
jgi:hypothetical protein